MLKYLITFTFFVWLYAGEVKSEMQYPIKKCEPVTAGTMLAIALASSLAGGISSGVSTFFGGKQQDKMQARNEALTREGNAQQERQFRDNLRQRNKEFDFSKIGANMTTLSNLASLRQVVAKPTASQKLLS